MRLRAATPILIVVLAIGTGCGDSNEAEPDRLDQAIAHLPPDTPLVEAIDVDAAREELGLDSDADATDVQATFGGGVSESDPLQRLVRDTGIGFPEVGQELQGAGDPVVSEAIDGSQLHAAVGTGQGDFAVTALATSQGFDEIAETLLAAGYRSEDDLVVAPDSSVPVGAVADAGDGIVIVARSPQLAEAAVDEGDGPQRLIDLLDSIDEPVRTASKGQGCVRGIAAGQSADATRGTARIEVDGEADAGRLDTEVVASTDPSYKFSRPKIDGASLSIGFEGPQPDVGAPTPLEGVTQTFTAYSAYKCG